MAVVGIPKLAPYLVCFSARPIASVCPRPSFPSMNIQTALARIIGGVPWGIDSKDWTVPLGPFAEGRPSLEPGRKGEFVPVFENQPTTIIAYRCEMVLLDDGSRTEVVGTRQPCLYVREHADRVSQEVCLAYVASALAVDFIFRSSWSRDLDAGFRRTRCALLNTV